MENSSFQNWKIFDQLTNAKLTPTIKIQLQKFYDLLVTENQKYNLTTITELNDVFQKHFVDSLLFTNNFPLDDQKLVDIGSGAGFPGLVLKIFYPELRVTLIESNSKKVNFLNLAIKTLGLKDVIVVDSRAEDYSREHKEEFDLVVSRAVAYLDIILELGAQMLKVGGYFILLKGPRADEELKTSGDIAKHLNLVLESTQRLVDIGFGTRVNLFYKKLGPTPDLYPRQYNVIKKASGQNKK